jgi:hypothetical protein
MTGLGVSNRSSSDARKILRVNQLNSPREPRRLSHAKFPGRNEDVASHVQLMLAGGGEFCDKAQDAVGVLTGCSAQLSSYFLDLQLLNRLLPHCCLLDSPCLGRTLAEIP